MRNYIVLAMLKSRKKSSVHGKSNKAKRRKDKVLLIKQGVG